MLPALSHRARRALVGALTAITLTVSGATAASAETPQELAKKKEEETKIALTAAMAIGAGNPLPAMPISLMAGPKDFMPVDNLGRPKKEILDQARNFANSTPMPDQIRGAILAGIMFWEGDGKSEIKLPEGATPRFKQFYWPSIASKCINAQSDAIGSGIAVPGPTVIPVPGAKEGETAFLFTALGTGKLNKTDMKVYWFNLNTFKSGVAPLGGNGINPEGPATVSGNAPTGKGNVIAVMDGSIDTIEKESNAHCSFIPTAAFFEVN